VHLHMSTCSSSMMVPLAKSKPCTHKTRRRCC
jgi:hypothetical protein